MNRTWGISNLLCLFVGQTFNILDLLLARFLHAGVHETKKKRKRKHCDRFTPPDYALQNLAVQVLEHQKALMCKTTYHLTTC